MKKSKIIIIAISAFFLSSCGFALAKTIPSSSERLINLHTSLIKDLQEEWSNLDELQQEYSAKLESATLKKQQLEEQANMFRETIKLLSTSDFK